MPVTSPIFPNFAKAENASLSFKDYPELSFHITQFELPGISIGTENIATPFQDVQRPSNKLTFEDLSVTFNIDEEFRNWNTLREWLINRANPNTFPNSPSENLIGTMIITTNLLNASHMINFYDVFPQSLSSVPFDLQQVEVIPLVSTVNFQYRYYDFTIL
jgi:uncharacterized protein YhdP